jgi:hypothetical protein
MREGVYGRACACVCATSPCVCLLFGIAVDRAVHFRTCSYNRVHQRSIHGTQLPLVGIPPPSHPACYPCPLPLFVNTRGELCSQRVSWSPAIGYPRRGAARRSVAWHGMAWHGMAWRGVGWGGVACCVCAPAFSFRYLKSTRTPPPQRPRRLCLESPWPRSPSSGSWAKTELPWWVSG